MVISAYYLYYRCHSQGFFESYSHVYKVQNISVETAQQKADN